MRSIIVLLSCLILTACAEHTAQRERCEKLHSVADSQAGAVCSVGHSCFSLDCTPQLLTDSEFHIFIEPCKHPAAILINATISGHKFSHEFSHSETVAIPYAIPLFSPKLAVIIDNSDNKTLVFSVLLIISQTTNYTLVPETRFPLTDITCVNGQLVTSPATPAPTDKTPGPYSCVGTCVAIHKMTDKTHALCQSTGNCLTINCNSPQQVSTLASFKSSYTIEPCKSPPTILATFDDNKNDKHFSQNITHNSTFVLYFNAVVNPRIQVILVDVDNFTILFGVNLIVATQSFQILPEQVIPIDKSGCPGYTGTDMNPYCTTQSTQTVTTHSISMDSHSTSMHSHSTATSMHPHIITTNGTSVSPSLNHTAVVGSDAGKLAGIIIGVILVNVVIVSISVLVTIGVVWYVFRRKNRSVYTYSHFQALEDDD